MRSAKKECYALIQAVVLKLNPVCQHPDCREPSVVGHHIFKRDRLTTAFLPSCVWGLCNHHHRYAHSHPEDFKNIVIGFMGYETYYERLRLSHTVGNSINFHEIQGRLKSDAVSFLSMNWGT
jgi:hypothetical protein